MFQYNFCISFFLSLLCSLILNAQAIDSERIQIRNLEANLFTNGEFGDFSIAYKDYLNVNDSIHYLALPRKNSGFLIIKIDSNNKLILAKNFKLDSSSSSTTYKYFELESDGNHIYVSFLERDGVLIKLDLDLNVVWSKRFPNSGKIDFDLHNNNIYLGYLYKDTSNCVLSLNNQGDLINSKIFYKAIYTPLDAILRNRLFLKKIDTSLIFISTANTPFDRNAQLYLFKMDWNLNIIDTSYLFFNPGKNFWISNVSSPISNSVFNIELQGLNTSRFASIIMDKNFNVVSSKFWSLNVPGINDNKVNFQNAFYFNNEEISVYSTNEEIYNLGQRVGNESNIVFTNSDFFTNWNYQNNLNKIYNFPLFLTGTNRVSGIYQNDDTTNIFMIKNENNNPADINCKTGCFVEINRILNSVDTMNCESLNGVSKSIKSNLNLIQGSFNFQILNLLVPVETVTLSESFISIIQKKSCFSALDTCNEIFVKILQDNDTICEDRQVVFNSLARYIDSFNWYINDTLRSQSDSLAYQFKKPGNYKIKLEAKATNTSQCFVVDSIEVLVLDLPEKLVNDTLVCKGDTIQLNASGMDNYFWRPARNLSCLLCPNPTLEVLDSTFFIITGFNSLGCIVEHVVNINIYPKPNATISGSNTLCPGITDVWFGLNPMDSFIATWWIDSVGIITQNFGDSIYTTWPMGIDSAFVYAYVQYPAGCEGDTIRFKVKVNQALEPKIVLNEDSICFSDRENINYNLTYNTNGSIYLWEIENGQILSGDSTASIKVSWDSLGKGKLIVREYSTTSIDTCFGADSVEIEILPNPENDLMLTGKEDVCLNEDVNYEITSGWPNSTYDWIASGSVNLSGQGTENIQTSWNSTGDYLVSVEEVSECGCRGPKDSLEVTVHPIPEPQRVGDDTLLCLDELGDQNYQLSGFANSVFNWSIEGGIIKSGQGTNSINVTWDSTIIKSLSVQEISEFACESEVLQIKQYFDLSRLELFVVSVSEDSSISMDFELESLRSYPGDSIWIARRTEVGDPGSGPGIIGDWARIVRIPKVITDYSDQSINPNQSSYGYRVEGLNTCEQEIMSRDHASVFLQGNRQIESQSENELVKLNWTAYRNWDGGVKSYELYEKFDSTYVKVAESNQTELIFNPKIPKKEHCFRIRAVQNGEERESWSNAFCIELERALNIPNVVTPNGDNKNDRLRIENLAAYPEHELTIYNRWGQEAFKTNTYNNNWPEENTISGTYFYKFRIEDKERNISEEYKGWIQVLR